MHNFFYDYIGIRWPNNPLFFPLLFLYVYWCLVSALVKGKCFSIFYLQCDGGIPRANKYLKTYDKFVLCTKEQLLVMCTELCVHLSEMPLFRKFPEIRKFQIERKNFRKNESVSLDENNWSKRGEKVFKKGKCIKIYLLKPNWQFIPYLTLTRPGFFGCSVAGGGLNQPPPEISAVDRAITMKIGTYVTCGVIYQTIKKNIYKIFIFYFILINNANLCVKSYVLL